MRHSRSIAVLCIFCLVLGCMAPVKVNAAQAGAKLTGAKIKQYDKVVTITIEDKDEFWFSRKMNQALSKAKEHADASTQYKIVIPPGNYKAIFSMHIPDNTHIYAKGAVITAADDLRCLIMGDAGVGTENVIIEGGTWDVSSQPLSDGSDTAVFRMAHIKNLSLLNLTVKCKRSGHIIELADINGLTVSGCTISGNTIYKNVQPKEAIQLDVATESAMVHMVPYNGKGCHNVLIEKNKFMNVARGVGSHNEMEAGVEKKPYTNVTIRNNTFKNLKGEAVYLMHWYKGSILNNTISNCRHAGIYAYGSSHLKISGNEMKNVKTFTGERAKVYDKEKTGIFLFGINKSVIRQNVLKKTKGKVVYKLGTNKGNKIRGNRKK